MVLLEVCANSVTSAITAQNGGAARVELCENLAEGGTTPSYGQIALTRQHLNIPINVLIRPRPGDFLYTDIEFDIMRADVEYAIQAGCNGIVIGMLDEDGNIDKVRCKELAALAHESGLSITFHRAFDVCRNFDEALEDIISIGCDRILTSGGRTTAIEGAVIIAHLVQKAAGRIIIMPGSGINETNVKDLVEFTGVTEVHASAKLKVQSRMKYLNDHILMNTNLDPYALDQTNLQIVSTIVTAIGD